jgi:hypothetical protein
VSARRRPRSSAAGYFAALSAEPPATDPAPLMASTDPDPAGEEPQQLALPVDRAA